MHGRLFSVARRRNTGNREQLTQGELGELRKRLSEMSLSTLEIFYRATHNACAYNAMRVPSPRLVQELVTAWKALRKVRS
jgi:hypothetical protein